MEAYMPLIIDIIAVLIIFMCMKNSARKGFVRTVIQFAGYLVSLVVANVGSKMAAVFLYDSYIRTSIVKFIEASLIETTNPDMILSELANAIDGLPPMISGIFSSGTENITSMLPAFEIMNAEQIAINLTDAVFAPMVMTAMRVLIFFLIFSIVFVIVKIVSRLFTGVNYIPLIGPVNALLGGVVGILEAFLFLYVASMLIDFVLIISGNSIPFLTREAINSTYVFSKFFDMKLML